MTNRTRTFEVRASFVEPSDAEAAFTALIEAGIARTSIDLRNGVLPEARQREGRFLSRVLLIIVLWSIAGALPGAAFGFLLAKTIGPAGTAGLIVQIVCWTIVGHLVGGMLAGYFVLADRTQREMTPDRPLTLLTDRDIAEGDSKNVQRLLRSHHSVKVTAGRSHGSVPRP
jgi:hypothetical protein